MPLFTDEGKSKITSVVNFTPSKFGSLPQGVLKVHITKPCATSTKVPPPPSSSTRFHPPPPSSLQYPQQYSNQNIAHIWAIFPNLGQIIQSCPLWLKIGSHGILEVLIPNPDLDFEILTQKPFFGQIWSQKVKVVCFVWTLTHMVSQGCWFLFQHQLSEILSPKLIFS